MLVTPTTVPVNSRTDDRRRDEELMDKAGRGNAASSHDAPGKPGG
jgi:hypothetical protein